MENNSPNEKITFMEWLIFITGTTLILSILGAVVFFLLYIWLETELYWKIAITFAITIVITHITLKLLVASESKSIFKP